MSGGRQSLPAGVRAIALTGEWGGQLLLPAQQSRSEGSVYLKVFQAPSAQNSLIGQVIQVKWSRLSGTANKYTPDVKFDAKELEEAQKAKNIVPRVLDGWDRVSPLESLAAARCFGTFTPTAVSGGTSVPLCTYLPLDRIYVRIQNEGLSSSGHELSLTEEPIVVAGTHVGLVSQITKSSKREGGGRFAVYSARTFVNGRFDEQQTLEFLVEEDFGPRPNFTFNKINSSPAGVLGWFLYGELDSQIVPGKNVFVAKAIEPRALLKVSGSFDVINSTAAAQEFLRYQDNFPTKNEYLTNEGLTRSKFASLENDFRRLRLLPGAGQTLLSAQNPIQKLSYAESNNPFQLGETGLVVHLFHWITDAKGKKDVGPLGLVSGHYSYGFYEVIREPLTGELQFEVVYQQVYGQGPDGVISSRVSRSEYMGSFRRGWSNSIATTDALVRAPWLSQPIDPATGAQKVGYTPQYILNDVLSLMTHAYRTGSGDGISSITAWASCVQDSSQALFIALRQVEKLLASTRGAQFCAANSSGIKGICNLLSSLKKQFDASDIFENAPMRGDWVNNALELQIRRSNNVLENSYAALASYKTALPRNAFNLFLGTMLERGADIMLMDNVQIGGYWTAEQRASTYIPVPATSIFDVVKMQISQARGQAVNVLKTQDFIDYILKAEGISSLKDLDDRLPRF